ncbi:MAG: hypothetical protein D0530_09085 [Methylococcales bacterium]|nr:MAG: hypothetical protein D0530_09085 [Methylococcales bacterium]
MKSILKIIISIALCWLTTTSNAFTNDDIVNRVKELDTNKDGGVSMTEAEAGNALRIIHNFDKLDVNKDNKVTAEEIEALNK